jgi:hypothetical protein
LTGSGRYFKTGFSHIFGGPTTGGNSARIMDEYRNAAGRRGELEGARIDGRGQ